MSGFGTPYDSPLSRFLQLVLRTFRIGSAFGVEVRMYWAALLLPLLFLFWAGSWAPSAAVSLSFAAVWFIGLFVVIWSHEMGHIAMGRRFGIFTDRISLGPLGGVAHMNAPAATPRQELLISLAGPAVHLVWLAILWPLQLWVPLDGLLVLDGVPMVAATIDYLVALNLGLMLFNLLPFFPLDGGRVARALLAMRWHVNRVTMWVTAVGIAGGVFLMLRGLLQPGFDSTFSLLIGLVVIQGCLHERRIARHASIYDRLVSMRRQPWESDPDAWKTGSATTARTRQRRGFFLFNLLRRWRTRRTARHADRALAERREFEREIDRILGRVHEVGMQGLTDKERATLKRASDRRRSTG